MNKKIIIVTLLFVISYFAAAWYSDFSMAFDVMSSHYEVPLSEFQHIFYNKYVYTYDTIIIIKYDRIVVLIYLLFILIMSIIRLVKNKKI